MELQILVSKKGTKVVTATNLYQVLELPNAQYTKNVKKWLTEVYEFRDGIRTPENLRDFSKRAMPENSIIDDYYISIELAKHITLISNSKKKQKFARHLLSLEDQVENAELLTKEQVIKVIELAKVMSLMSCQTASEEAHLRIYEDRNGGTNKNWWHFRAKTLGYSASALRDRMSTMGKPSKGKNMREMLLQVDKYEMIRSAVVDLFMSMGKTERYSQNLGDLAKRIAKEMNLDIHDDRKGRTMFAPDVNNELMNAVKRGQWTKEPRLWQS